jgi:hypothetical protein
MEILNSLAPEDNPSLKLDLNAVPFWKALDQIAAGAGAQVQLYRGDGKIELVKRGKSARLPVYYHDAFRVALRKLATSQDFATGARGSTLTMEVAWDPSFEPLYLETRPHQLVLLDDSSKPVDLNPLGSLWTSVDGRRATSFEVPLPALPRTAARIGTLKGAFPVRGPVRMHEFRWTAKDGRDFTLKELYGKKLPLTLKAGPDQTVCALNAVDLDNPDSWTVQIATELPESGPEFESFQPWFAHNQVYLLSRDGRRRLLPLSYSQENAGTRKAVLNYRFTDSAAVKRGKPEDWVLVCRAPAAMVELSIPFEFKDVPLP